MRAGIILGAALSSALLGLSPIVLSLPSYSQAIDFSVSNSTMWMFESPASGKLEFAVDAKVTNAESMAVVLWIVDAQLGLAYEASSIFMPVGTHLRAAVVGEDVDVSFYENPGCDVDFGCGRWRIEFLPMIAAGDWFAILVVGVAGEVQGTASFSGDVDVGSVVVGPALLAHEYDFAWKEPGLHARVPEGALGMSHIVNATLDVNVRDRFFGLFEGFSDASDPHISYQSPDGSGSAPTTYFDGTSPGAYTFRIDEFQDVRVYTQQGGVIVVGADLRLPGAAA